MGGIVVALRLGAGPEQPARATPAEQVAVLPVDGRSTLPARIQVQLRSRIEQGLTRARVGLVDDAQVDEHLRGDACVDAQCTRALAQSLSVSWVLRSTITVEDSVYVIQLDALGDDGEPLASATARCEICGYHEVTELVIDRSAALAAKVRMLEREPPRLWVRSSPGGAEVWIDGVAVGRTPLELELEDGEHELRLVRDGYATERRRLRALAGTTETVAVDLFPVEPEPQVQPRRWPALGLGIAALATGALVAGTGVALVAIDEREYQRRCNPDPLGNCAQLYDTLGGGVALVATGVVLLAAGVTLVVLDRRRGAAPRRLGRRLQRGHGLALAF